MMDPRINCFYEKDRFMSEDLAQVSICNEQIDLCLAEKTTSLLSYPLNQVREADKFINDIKAYTVFDGMYWDPIYGRSTGVVYYRLSHPDIVNERLWLSSVDNQIVYEIKTTDNINYEFYLYENGGIKFGQTLKNTDFKIKSCYIREDKCNNRTIPNLPQQANYKAV
jgi:hypothetical protein